MQWKEYITFTKRERNGVITLVVLILLIAVAPELFPKAVINAAPAKEAGGGNGETGRAPSAYKDSRYSHRVYSNYRPSPGEERRYDEEEQGLTDDRRAVYSFREGITGGYRYRYRQRDDPEEEVTGRRKASGNRYYTSGKSSYDNSRRRERYTPGGRMAGKTDYRRDNRPAWTAPGNSFGRPQNKSMRYTDNSVSGNINKSHVFRKMAIIDINKADTAAFIALPGIGGKLAARIVLFRAKLGGFNSIEQVREIYGLPDSTYSDIARWLTCKPGEVEKININDSPLDKLYAHPYLRGNIAAAIFNYRKQHGIFQSLNDLNKIQSLQPSDLEKILPYLSVNDRSTP